MIDQALEALDCGKLSYDDWIRVGMALKNEGYARVLYVNREIDPASCIHRFQEIYRAAGIKPMHQQDILIWNLRRETEYDASTPVTVRKWYVEGAGQLCEACFVFLLDHEPVNNSSEREQFD